jgi:dTDP-4-dehydrorhamnose reductase
MARIAIIGNTGYVGKEIYKTASEKGHQPLAINRKNCDIYNINELAKMLSFLQAEWVINCAGYTGKPNVDACEYNKAECLIANTALPTIISQVCDSLCLPWGQLGSGCIYQGHRYFTENCKPNFTFKKDNCSFYSGTKALMEEILNTSTCYIWRLRMPFSNVSSDRNLLSKLLKYKKLLNAVNSLSNLQESVRAILESFEQQIPFGIYNLTQPGAITTKTIVDMIKKHQITKKRFDFYRDEQDFSQNIVAPRSNCTLDVNKILSTGIKLLHIEESIERSLRNWCEY